MLKVILLIDNYNELTYLQTTLRNLGFDIEPLQREAKLEETLLSFKADVIIATGASKKINGVRVAISLHQKKVAPKVILIFPAATAPKLEGPLAEVVAAILLSPVNSTDLMATLGQVGHLDMQQLSEKLARLHKARQMSGVGDADSTFVKSRSLETEGLSSRDVEADHGVVEGKMGGGEKQEVEYFSKDDLGRGFDKLCKSTPPPQVERLSKSQVAEAAKQLKEFLKEDETSDLESERRAFVNALFGTSKTNDNM